MESEGEKVRLSDSQNYEHYYNSLQGDAKELPENDEVVEIPPIKEKTKRNIIVELEEEKYPKFSADLTDSEKEIVISFRMMSHASQTKLKKNIKKILKDEGILK